MPIFVEIFANWSSSSAPLRDFASQGCRCTLFPRPQHQHPETHLTAGPRASTRRAPRCKILYLLYLCTEQSEPRIGPEIRHSRMARPGNSIKLVRGLGILPLDIVISVLITPSSCSKRASDRHPDRLNLNLLPQTGNFFSSYYLQGLQILPSAQRFV